MYDLFCKRVFYHSQQHCTPMSLSYIYAVKKQVLSGQKSFGELRFYVQLLLERGFLSEACVVVEDFFGDCYTVFIEEGSKSLGRYCSIPYSIIDRLLSSCDKVLMTSTANQGTISRLQISRDRLVIAIERYFSVLS